MRRVAAIAALALFAVAPGGEASGQPISAEELHDWANQMNQFRYGPKGCPLLVDKVQRILRSFRSGEDTRWEWTDEDFGRGVAGYTHYEFHPVTGETRNHRTEISIPEANRSSHRSFLWGIAHEALHWVNNVGVENGRETERHLGPDWQRLNDCFTDAW